MAKGRKEVSTVFKIQAPGGQATPAPPIGPALGQHGVNPGQFIQQFNERSRDYQGKTVGCVITVYRDRTFDFEIKSPPASVLIKEAAGLSKGTGSPQHESVGQISRDQLEAIAKEKQQELNAHDLEAAVKMVAGTARSMGVSVES